MQLIIYEPVHADRQAFIDFWAARYTGYDDDFYYANVGHELTEARILDLFEWKNGRRLPADVVILLHVSAAAKPVQSAFLPYPVRAGAQEFHFYIPGMLFTLANGPAPLAEASLAHPPNRLAISSAGDDFMQQAGLRHVANSEPSDRLKKKLP